MNQDDFEFKKAVNSLYERARPLISDEFQDNPQVSSGKVHFRHAFVAITEEVIGEQNRRGSRVAPF